MRLPLYLLLLLLLLPPSTSQEPSSTPIPSGPCPLELDPPSRLVNSIPTDLPFYRLTSPNLGQLPCLGIPLTRVHLLTTNSCVFPALSATRGNQSLAIVSVTASASLAVLRHPAASPLQTSPYLVNTDAAIPTEGQIARIVGLHNDSGVIGGPGIVDVRVASAARCATVAGVQQVVNGTAVNATVTNTTVCAGRRRCGTCWGDGGAVLVQLDALKQPVVMAVGQVVTRCGREGLDVFEAVAGYVRWMREDVGLRLRTGQVASMAPSAVISMSAVQQVEETKEVGSMSPVPKEVIEGVGGEKSGGFWGVVAAVGVWAVLALVVLLVWKKGGWEKMWVGARML